MIGNFTVCTTVQVVYTDGYSYFIGILVRVLLVVYTGNLTARTPVPVLVLSILPSTVQIQVVYWTAIELYRKEVDVDA